MATPPLMKVYRTLLRRFGPQRWWPACAAGAATASARRRPAASPFEVMVGAILTQNTAWINVEKAIRNLKEAGLLDPKRILKIDRSKLARVIRPSGTFNIKSGRLKDFARWFIERFDGDIERIRREPTARLRGELLAVKGIGPETADSILLYALDHRSFVVDAYTHRVLKRHAIVGEKADDESIKALFESKLPRDRKLYNEFHALIVAVGKEYCRPVPRCDTCPLKPLLPRGGPAGCSPLPVQKGNPSAGRRRGFR